MHIKGKLFHVCIFDPWCWKCWWQYGSPMRIHIGEKFWTFPLLGWRHDMLWKDVVPVEIKWGRPIEEHEQNSTDSNLSDPSGRTGDNGGSNTNEK